MHRMRVAMILVLFAHVAAAQSPEGSVHEEVLLDKRITLGVDSAMRVRTDGEPTVGAGISARFARGQWGLSLSLMRWHPLDDDTKQRSTELALQGYRYLKLSNRTRGYIVGGASYELVDIVGRDITYGKVGALVGAGLSWNVVEKLTAWMQVTLEAKRWLDRPETVERSDEVALMFMFGLSF